MVVCNFFNQRTGEWLESIGIERRADSKFFRNVRDCLILEALNADNIIGFITADFEPDYRKAADNYCRYGKVELFAPRGALQALYVNDVCIRTFY